MTIHYKLPRFGADEDAVGRLINGDLPADDDERWQIVDGPRWHLRRLLDEHQRAQTALRDCRDSGRPFVLFLRSFSAEFKGHRIDGAFGDHFTSTSLNFQRWLKFTLGDEDVPIVKLHGGSDGFFSDWGDNATILSADADNWQTVAVELIQAASAIVFLVSHLTAGVVEEFELIRKHGQRHRCLVMLLDPSRTPQGPSDGAIQPRGRLADFQHVFELDPVGTSFRSLGDPGSVLTGLLRDARTRAPLDQALRARFTYLEPAFTQSEDFTTTETYIWRQLRLLRVMFDDTYWAALKTHGIGFDDFSFPGPWRIAHQVYGLAIETADFRAMREALSYLHLLYIKRGADFALVLPYLSAQYGELSASIFPDGEPDTEARYAPGQDPLKLPATSGVAIDIFRLAEAAAGRQDSETAMYWYQAAVICALRAADVEDRQRRWIAANICRDWAQFQGHSPQLQWAVTNCAFAARLFRDLAAAHPDEYTRDLGLCLNNLGSLYFRQRRFSAAEAAFIEALEIRRRASPDAEHYLVDLYTSLANLGLLRTESGDLESARTIYAEALTVCEKRVDSEPMAIVDLTRVLWWMSLCLAKSPLTRHESSVYVQRAAGHLAAVSQVNPEAEAELRQLVDAALRAPTEPDEAQA